MLISYFHFDCTEQIKKIQSGTSHPHPITILQKLDQLFTCPFYHSLFQYSVKSKQYPYHDKILRDGSNVITRSRKRFSLCGVWKSANWSSSYKLTIVNNKHINMQETNCYLQKESNKNTDVYPKWKRMPLIDTSENDYKTTFMCQLSVKIL